MKKAIRIAAISCALMLVAVCLQSALVARAASLQYGQAADGTFSATSEKVEYTFDGKSGDKLTVAVNAIGGDIDPFVDVYNPQGQLVGEDDNSGGKDNARINGLVLAGDGTYKISAMNNRKGTSGKFSLVVSKQVAQGTIFFDGPKNQAKENFQLSRPWDHTNVTYKIENTLPNFNASDVNATIQQAFQAWANVTPLRFQQVTSGNPDIDISFGPIDGPMNILGETCPPYSSGCSGQVQFDSQENWVMGQPDGYNNISFLAVASHELGHAIGLLHSSDASALMYPEYSPYNLQPAADDIRGAQQLYGAGGTGGVVTNPTPAPGSSTGNGSSPTVRGTITDAKFTNFWDFDVNAGESVTITMQSASGGLDPLLIVIDANNNILAYDDDSGGGKNSMLTNLRFPQAGTYTVAATRYQQAQGYTSGDYILSITYGASSGPSLPTPTSPSPFGTAQQVKLIPSLQPGADFINPMVAMLPRREDED